jgi:hypothetical protein
MKSLEERSSQYLDYFERSKVFELYPLSIR